MIPMRLRGLAVGATSFALLATVSAVSRAQGTLTGTVTAQVGGTPLQEARVILVGTSLVGSTGPDGKFRIVRVPAGTAEVRVIRVGYQEQKKSVRIVEGQTATLDFAMTQSVVQLEEVVTTATGDQRRAEVGNAVENLSVSSITAVAPVRTISDVLAARVPGVMIQAGTQTGVGQRIRVRGISSLSLSNEPIFIIDGIRMSNNNGSTAFGDGGNNQSRLGDLSPEDIDNIEIVKGPSAATLYGTDAANGVVVITTKRGRAGATRWTLSAERGAVDDRNHFLDTYMIFGHTTANPTAVVRCVLIQISAKSCIPDSTSHLNPMMMDSLTPLNIGNRSAYNV